MDLENLSKSGADLGDYRSHQIYPQWRCLLQLGQRGSQFWKILHKIKHLFKAGARHTFCNGRRTLLWLCNAPRSVLCRLERFPPNPHNSDPRTPTRHNVHVATHTLCGWNCDNITTVLDGTHKRTYLYKNDSPSQEPKDTIQRTK